MVTVVFLGPLFLSQNESVQGEKEYRVSFYSEVFFLLLDSLGMLRGNSEKHTFQLKSYQKLTFMCCSGHLVHVVGIF